MYSLDRLICYDGKKLPTFDDDPAAGVGFAPPGRGVPRGIIKTATIWLREHANRGEVLRAIARHAPPPEQETASLGYITARKGTRILETVYFALP